MAIAPIRGPLYRWESAGTSQDRSLCPGASKVHSLRPSASGFHHPRLSIASVPRYYSSSQACALFDWHAGYNSGLASRKPALPDEAQSEVYAFPVIDEMSIRTTTTPSVKRTGTTSDCRE